MLTAAFYLPQYHPIPENDEWWGKGFTEWRNVTRAQPRFKGHYQPHLPADLGFYDLRLAETRTAQAELARSHGIGAFCYYHYWFGGRRLLERPFAEVLSSGEPDFPFMLCWANENWTRTWDGAEMHQLMPQMYSEGDDRAHLRHLAAAFADPRYVRIDGKPVFLVYHASHMPDVRRTTDTWRDEASRLGIGELFLGRVEAHGPDRGDPVPLGFDAGVEFQPDVENYGPRRVPGRLVRRAQRSIGVNRGVRENFIHSYDQLMTRSLAKPAVAYTRFRCVTPAWDNSARRAEGAWILEGSTPDKYEAWLRAAALETRQRVGEGAELLFVNAWNEWAEGNHLEPDLRYGRAYLEATRRGLA